MTLKKSPAPAMRAGRINAIKERTGLSEPNSNLLQVALKIRSIGRQGKSDFNQSSIIFKHFFPAYFPELVAQSENKHFFPAYFPELVAQSEKLWRASCGDLIWVAGFNTQKEFAAMLGEPVQNIINWHRDKPERFDTLLMGAVCIHVWEPI